MQISLTDAAPALVGSFAVCACLILTQRWHGRLSLDHDVESVQKVHRQPVPRVGGLGLFLGILLVGLIGWLADEPQANTLLVLLACSLPAFGAGLAEDLSKRVPVRTRLIASFVSGGLAAWFLGAHLTRLDTPGLDLLVAITPLSILFTAFAVGGVTNAVNIIDGLNGLASGCVVLMLGGLGAIAWAHQDALVLYLCLTGIGATLGFLLLNYPFGRIFLGDGGAYLAGFWVAECAVLLLVRNPNVSTWGPLLVCFYPVWETGFSMYRRSFIRKTHSGKPDMVHFHHLLLRRFVSRHLEAQQPAWIRHAWTSALLWGFVLACQLLAVIANAQSMLLGIGALAFGVLYLRTYSALVHACQPASGLLGISDDVYVEPNVEPSLYVDQR